MDDISDADLLREVMRADEDVSIPTKTVNRLVEAGLVVVRGCSDGDYIEPTDSGRKALDKENG